MFPIKVYLCIIVAIMIKNGGMSDVLTGELKDNIIRIIFKTSFLIMDYTV